VNFFNRGAHFTFTRLHARITEEDGAYTVRVRMLNHLNLDESAFGEEIAATIDMAELLVKRREIIPQESISALEIEYFTL